MARRKGTDGSLLASLPWTLAAISFAIVPHLQYLPAWVTVSFFGCAAWRWQIERKRWRLPAAWARIILSLICFLGIIATYGSVSGVGPGSALLAIMAALKLVAPFSRFQQFECCHDGQQRRSRSDATDRATRGANAEETD